MFFAANLSTATSGQLARAISETSGQLSPRLSFTSTGSAFVVYEGADTGARAAEAPSGGFIDRDSFILVTFSQANGLKIYLDGVLEDDEPTETSPFDIGFEAGEWQMFNAMRGKVGLTGLCDVDLGSSANDDLRTKLHNYVLPIYGL